MTRPWPPTSPSSTTRGARRIERRDGGRRRGGSGPGSPAKRTRPASGPPESSPATAERPATLTVFWSPSAAAKTNQDGETNDVRYLKDGAALCGRALRAAAALAPEGRVVLLSPQAVGLRFTAEAEAAGIERRVTAHSGRVGLASELTSRGASTTDVMLAGNWKTSRMVAHYFAGATAERGAVAR